MTSFDHSRLAVWLRRIGLDLHGGVLLLTALGGGGWAYRVLQAVRTSPDYANIGGTDSPWALASACAFTGLLFAIAVDYSLLLVGTRLRLILPNFAKDPQHIRYRLPPWPVSGRAFNLVLGEFHGTKVGYSKHPAWYLLPEAGLYTGVIIFGAPGSAKTAGIIRPALQQLLETTTDPQRKPCGLIQDSKASLVAPAVEVARATGREADLVIIGPGRPYKWNPVHAPEAEPRVIAGWMLDAIHNMGGDSGKGDTAWISDNTRRLAECLIGLIRLAGGYVTLEDVHVLAGDLSAALDNADGAPGAAAEQALRGYDGLFNARNPCDAERAQYQYFRRWLTVDFAGTEARYRNIYSSELTRITQFFSDPSYRERFSPPLAAIDFPSFLEAIDKGLLVVLDCNAAVYGGLADALATFLKLQYQQAVRARVALPHINQVRPALWICDEVQRVITLSDAEFFDVARQSRAIGILATQSRAGLVAKIGKERVDALLGSVGTKIFLRLAEPEDQKWAADTCGADWGEVQNTNVSESVSAAKLVAGGRFVGDNTTVSESYSVSRQKLHRFEAVAFRDLPAFSAIVSGFDGLRALPPALVYLKPYFRPRNEPYRDFIRELFR